MAGARRPSSRRSQKGVEAMWIVNTTTFYVSNFTTLQLVFSFDSLCYMSIGIYMNSLVGFCFEKNDLNFRRNLTSGSWRKFGVQKMSEDSQDKPWNR
jgi:hypothetical protein